MEDIITVPDNQRFAAPRLMRSLDSASAGVQGDTAEVIILEREDGQRQTHSVFDCAGLIGKLAGQQKPA